MGKYDTFAGYAFDEWQHTNYDSIGTHDLLVHSSVGTRPGKHNKARNFEPYQSGNRSTMASCSFPVVLESWTTCLWFYSDVVLDDRVLVSLLDDDKTLFSITTFNGHIAIQIQGRQGGTQIMLGQQSINNEEHFVAASYDNEALTLYFDGTYLTSTSLYSIHPILEPFIQYGTNIDSASLPWNGWIDSAVWANKALSISALHDIYNAADGRDIGWFLENNVFTNNRVFKRSKHLIMNRPGQLVAKRDKNLILTEKAWKKRGI